MMTKRETLLAIFRAGLAAVMPEGAVNRHLSVDGDGHLYADGKKYLLAGRRVRVLGAGKGAAPMAVAIEKLLGDYLDDGLVVVKYGHGLPLGRIKLLEAAHPAPDAAGEKAARAMLRFAGECGPDDLLICLFTGGASALMPATAIDLDDFIKTTNLLLECGAPIDEINAVRKHLSEISGGRLAIAANGAEILSLIISDVIGDDLDVIASGPTVPDNSTFGEAMQILEKRGIRDSMPQSARERLRAGSEGAIDETPKDDNPAFSRVFNLLCATNRQALEAARAEAENLGYQAEIVTDSLSGEAREKAVELCNLAFERQKKSGRKPLCLLAGGETTVTIRGAGKGGRNQEMALAANICLAGKEGISALFAGTDGTDGPTAAAGGFAFADGASRMGGIEKAKGYLASNDSNRALTLAGELLETGPTLTNVMDMAIFLVDGAE